jgi:hypothetical protein
MVRQVVDKLLDVTDDKDCSVALDFIAKFADLEINDSLRYEV